MGNHWSNWMIRTVIYQGVSSTGKDPKLTSRLGNFEVHVTLLTEVLKQYLLYNFGLQGISMG